MSLSSFPLRWESTGHQWWYASPIDFAAANGLYDLVTELLHLDTNLLIKLTSLRRIRRLETVWDDESQFEHVTKCRSHVAKNLMIECEETGTGKNSLISGGYGGWLLYTAASAGEFEFVSELLRRDPLLVFGEGEYGVTDMFYAAARSKNFEVFEMILDFALLRKESGVELLDENGGGVFKREIVNRAIHAAARGGNWEVVEKKLNLGSDYQILLSYRDVQGSTVLHSAAGRGQVEVVRNLIMSLPGIINSTDGQGNTALHVASYRGYLPVVEILIQASPSLTMLTNHNGDTFLHMAVYGFKSHGFCRLDKHTELMHQLVLTEKVANMKDIINVRNNAGRTAIHEAVIHDVNCDVVESMMSVAWIDLNVRDADGMTPLDYLKQRPRSKSSEVLIRQLISAGGISNCEDCVTRNAIVTHLKTRGIQGSPGTSFRISDSKIFLYTYIDNENSFGIVNNDQTSIKSNVYSIEVDSCYESAANSPCKTTSSVDSAAKRLKNLLKWHRRRVKKEAASEFEDNDDDSVHKLGEFPTSLRQRYSKQYSLPNNKRTLSIKTLLPSSSAKEFFTTGLMQGVIKVKSQFEGSNLSHSSNNKQKHVDTMGPVSCSNEPIEDGGTLEVKYKKERNLNKKLMNKYFSFGAQGQGLEDANSCTMSNHSSKCFSYLVA